MAEQRQATEIPNLLSLRGTGGGRRRGGPSSIGHGRTQEDAETRKDRIVQQTDNDASGSRMSAVSLGYLNDPFAQAFLQGAIPRRYPIINRGVKSIVGWLEALLTLPGTYIRTTAINRLVDAFLSTDPDSPKQIISLGAGSDTRYFRIVIANPAIRLTYHELDFATNTTSKISSIKRTPSLLKAIHTHLGPDEVDSLLISSNGDSLYSPTYNVHPLDLRSLAVDDPASLPKLPNLSPTTPTLLLSECCLIYLPPAQADAILQTLANQIIPHNTALSLVLYEPIHPHDSFGQVMVSNLAQRGIILQTLHKYHSLAAQLTRLSDATFVDGQNGADVEWLFQNWLDQEEKDRVGKCEMLDEMEEWILLGRHYAVCWGWRGDVFGRAWATIEGQETGG
ncbi:putative leucine carboxyl methyltransferase superfamily [Venturia nashicola]|nr:putative leucine carboxyl methyltransferase superfamily [Venturia nashicola]